MSAFSKSTNLHRGLYALPAFVLAFPTIPVFVLLPAFYAETVGLGLAAVGLAFTGLRLLDVVSDPLLGWLSDRIPGRYGRRKLPIAFGGLIGAPALIALFSPPEQASILYLVIWGALLFLAWTAIQIPYLAWAAELEPDYGKRAALNGWREGTGLLGILAVSGLGVLLADRDIYERFSLTAWLTVVAGFIVISLALRFVPSGHVAKKQTRISFPGKNRLFLRVLGAWFINGLANGLPAVCFPLYLTHILKADEQVQAGLIFIYFLFAVIGIPVWVTLAASVNKHRIWCLSMVLACLTFIFVPWVGAGDFIAFGLICIFTGLALGSDLSLPPAIQADCADWDRLKFRQNRLATLYSYWSMATKMALALAVGLAFPLLEYVDLPSESVLAKNTLIVIYAGLPVVLKIIAIMLMWNFPLGRNQHLAVQHALERRL